MPVLPILKIPDPRLTSVSEPIVRFDSAIHSLAGNLLDTLHHAAGLGLTGIHIGIAQRLVVIDLHHADPASKPMFFANPKLVFASKECSIFQEGSLSMPGIYEDVVRPSRIMVSYQDLEGNAREIEADGLLSTCLQHEIDQLDGIMFYDHLSKLKRDRLMKKYIKSIRSGP